MTPRDTFIEKHRHEFSGLMLDLAINRCDGSELSIKLRRAMNKIDAGLGAIYDSFHPKPVPAAPQTNGTNGNTPTRQEIKK